MKTDIAERLEKIGNELLSLAVELNASNDCIETPTQGTGTVSVEFSHAAEDREEIAWKSLATKEKLAKFILPLVVGKTCNGQDLIVELSTLPHLIIGGTAGRGKTTLLRSIICGLVANYSPDEVRFILSDAKWELSSFATLPHLGMPIITESRRFVLAMRWAVAEMKKRLKMLARVKCRNIPEFNAQAKEKIPYIVIIVDEWSDLFYESGKKLVSLISQLTAKSHEVGIHLMLATQRINRNIISEVLKANMPGRVAFMTSCHIDSRAILDATGAENLSGRNMLIRGKDGQLIRVQGAIIHDDDIEALVAKAADGYDTPAPLYRNSVMETIAGFCTGIACKFVERPQENERLLVVHDLIE